MGSGIDEGIHVQMTVSGCVQVKRVMIKMFLVCMEAEEYIRASSFRLASRSRWADAREERTVSSSEYIGKFHIPSGNFRLVVLATTWASAVLKSCMRISRPHPHLTSDESLCNAP